MYNKEKSHTLDQIRSKMEHYCVYQDRCHFDVEKKLRDFFLIPEARDEILLWLLSEKFLDEERFAKSFARGRFKIKNWGRKKISVELKRRNISDYLINVGLKEIEEEAYYSTAERLIEKKKENITAKNIYELKKKIISYMLNKGYEYDLIKEIISEVVD